MERYRTILRIGQIIAAIGLVAFWFFALLVQPDPGGKPFGVDAHPYWSVPLSDPYSGPEAGLPGAYLYSPAFLHAITPLRLLPWEWFIGIWIAAELVALAWLLTPAGALVALAFPPILSEVLIGNVHVFMAVALALSIRFPATWLLALLTKPTLGVGIAYYIARRAWRSVAVALGVTLVVVAVSFAIGPGLWLDWVERIQGAESRGGLAWTVFLVVRLVLAMGLAWYAGWRGRPAFLPLAAYLALPIPWLEGLALLTAVPRLVRWGRA
ncbi:MAG: glycosyltransferase family 87 protein [Candidatus Limnocylindria bacterium]